jgi:hypothetical protein
MPKYSFDVILRVSPFEAENEEQAVEFLNNHLDQLCEVKNEIVQWPDVDWTMYSDELDNVEVIEYPESTS